MRGLLVAVACFGFIAWAARSIWESQHPAAIAARGLSAPRPSDRARATRELRDAGTSEPGLAIPPLVGALGDPSAEVRAGAAEALGVIAGQMILDGASGELPRVATAALIRALEDRDPLVRIVTMGALERVVTVPGADAAIDVSAVVRAFAAMPADRDDEVRLIAMQAYVRCAALRPADPPPALTMSLEAPAPRVRAAAVRALAALPRPLDPWLPYLLRGLRHEEPPARAACRLAFYRKPGAFSAGAIPALLEALGRDDRLVRISAALGLEPHRQDPRVDASLVPALLQILKSPDHDHPDPDDPIGRGLGTTWVATSMLGRVAPGTARAREAVSALAAAVRSGDSNRLQSATSALASFGPSAEPAVPALVETLRESLARKDPLHSDECDLIARSLAKIAPGTPSAPVVIAALGEMARSAPALLRFGAANALKAFGPAAEPAVPALIDALRQSRPENEYNELAGAAIVAALVRIAPGTKSAGTAVAGLIAALDSGPAAPVEPWYPVVKALGAFGSEAAPALPRLRAAAKDATPGVRQAAARAVAAIEAPAAAEQNGGSPADQLHRTGEGKAP